MRNRDLLKGARDLAVGAAPLMMVLLALLACKKEGGSTASSEKPAAAADVRKPEGTAAAASAAAAAPAAAYDAVGAEKKWGEHTVTLKEATFSYKKLKVVFVIKNGENKDENVSSLAHFEAITDEGDKGDLDIMGGDVSCDGAIPPKGVLKCKLGYKFPQAPKEVKVKVGAGVLSEAIWFTLKGT